jgi:hypothetical protein
MQAAAAVVKITQAVVHPQADLVAAVLVLTLQMGLVKQVIPILAAAAVLVLT